MIIHKIDSIKDANAERKRKADLESVAAIAFVSLAESGQVDDITATEHMTMFSEWGFPIAYTADQVRQYDGKLYRCLQAHTSQSDWTPPASQSLWKEIGDPTVAFPEWSQPIGAMDAYALGDKVSHSGKHWQSDYDANVWEPGVFGWTEVADA